MRRAGPIALVLAAAFAAAGCGGSSSNKAQIESTIRTYYTAFANGDSAKACDQLSTSTRATLEHQGGGRKCADLLTAAGQRPGAQKVKPALKSPKFGAVNVTGNNATASVTVAGTPTTVPLKKEGGDWKIVSAVGG